MVVPHNVAGGFSRRHKLLGAQQFRFVLSQKKSVYTRYFSAHVMENAAQCPRIGITVSRKVSMKAVQRNRIKRHIRNSFRMNKTQPQFKDKDFVVTAKVGCADVDNRSMREDLELLWIKVSNR